LHSELGRRWPWLSFGSLGHIKCHEYYSTQQARLVAVLGISTEGLHRDCSLFASYFFAVSAASLLWRDGARGVFDDRLGSMFYHLAFGCFAFRVRWHKRTCISLRLLCNYRVYFSCDVFAGTRTSLTYITMWPNTALEPTPVTPVSFRCGLLVGGSHWRRGSAFGR
jgi:hypothetical protein